MGWLDTKSMTMANKSMDYLWEKQRVISENLANSTTPGYKAKYVTFEEELRKNLSKFDGQDRPKSDEMKEAILNSKIRVHETNDESVTLDGNNVNVEAENVELARVQLQYQYLSRAVDGQFQKLRLVLESR